MARVSHRHSFPPELAGWRAPPPAPPAPLPPRPFASTRSCEHGRKSWKCLRRKVSRLVSFSVTFIKKPILNLSNSPHLNHYPLTPSSPVLALCEADIARSAAEGSQDSAVRRAQTAIAAVEFALLEFHALLRRSAVEFRYESEAAQHSSTCSSSGAQAGDQQTSATMTTNTLPQPPQSSLVGQPRQHRAVPEETASDEADITSPPPPLPL